jgi:hypothetical protein
MGEGRGVTEGEAVEVVVGARVEVEEGEIVGGINVGAELKPGCGPVGVSGTGEHEAKKINPICPIALEIVRSINGWVSIIPKTCAG